MSSKNILILGAGGRVGRMLVERALADGHHVIAFVHYDKSPFLENKRLRIVHGDVYRKEDIEQALNGVDVVISALGSWGTARKDVLSSAMQNIIPLMHKMGVRRIVSLTGAEARANGDKLTWTHNIAHFVFSIVAGKVLQDGEKHIKLLEKSDLDWVVVRSPIMTGGKSNVYKLTNKRPMPWEKVDRSAVVEAILLEAISANISQRSPYIT